MSAKLGPWFVGAQNDYPYVIDRAPKSSNDHPDHDADVALVAKPFEVRGMPVMDVARLLAAAPDLLEALQEIASNDPFHQSSAGIIARVAIQKATGETP